MSPAIPAAGQLLVRRFAPAPLPADSMAIPAGPSGMPPPDEQQVIDWVNDAFAILCGRAPGSHPAEVNLRRGLEVIVRHTARTAPPVSDPTRPAATGEPELSAADLRNILDALDACLTVFTRNDNRLNTAQRRIHILVRACRRNADDAVRANGSRSPFSLRALIR